GDAAQGRDADAHLAVRRLQLRHRARRQAGVFRAVSPGSIARAARLALSVPALCRPDEGEETGLNRRRWISAGHLCLTSLLRDQVNMIRQTGRHTMTSPDMTIRDIS